MPDGSVEIVATREYPYSNVKVKAGDHFHVPSAHADLLIRTGLATRAPGPSDQDEIRPRRGRPPKRREADEPDA